MLATAVEYSLKYKQAIATLAEHLKDSDFISIVDLPQLLESNAFPWDTLVERFPQAQEIVRAAQSELNYELSINQCCNALNWLDKCDPSEWQYLLTEKEKAR